MVKIIIKKFLIESTDNIASGFSGFEENLNDNSNENELLLGIPSSREMYQLGMS